MKRVKRTIDPTDWVGYETLIKFIKSNKIHKVPGDFVEIGTLFGGGAKKLAVFLKKYSPSKKLYTIDIFDPNFDITENASGDIMSDLYLSGLKKIKGKTQWEIFKRITSGQNNIIAIKSDSKKAKIPVHKIAFTFIDGNHQPSYVINDFYLVWGKTAVGGFVSFHDYGGDLPEVTKTIDHLIKSHRKNIKSYKVSGRNMIFLKKI
ncbi:MAG: class I SAM-dependent methyltransferase [Candidatus Levybacteria bacterium]|nr:class I SAM-dependent methyltransferase [Candidatus Levybacteria bacterium]